MANKHQFYLHRNQSVEKYFKNNADKSFRFQKKNIDLQRNQGKNVIVEGAIAQLVEQRTENPCVAGSNPAGTTKSESNRF